MDKIAKGIVIGGLLNLRESSSTNAKVIEVLTEGTKLEINLTRSTDNWYYVNVNSVPGYVMKNFVKITKEPKEPKASPEKEGE